MTVAFALQLALVGTLLLVVAATIGDAIHYDGLIDEAARTAGAAGEEVASERAGNVGGALMTAVPAVLVAVWLASTAFWLRRGSNVARILTLVALATPLGLGLVACVLGGMFGLLAFGFFALAPEGVPPDGAAGPGEEPPFYGELARLDSYGWSVAFGVVRVTGLGVALLLGIAVGVLLLTRASNRYFGWQEPAPAVRYPQYYPPPAAPWVYAPQPSWHGVPAPPMPTPPPGRQPPDPLPSAEPEPPPEGTEPPPEGTEPPPEGTGPPSPPPG